MFSSVFVGTFVPSNGRPVKQPPARACPSCEGSQGEIGYHEKSESWLVKMAIVSTLHCIILECPIFDLAKIREKLMRKPKTLDGQ